MMFILKSIFLLFSVFISNLTNAELVNSNIIRDINLKKTFPTDTTRIVLFYNSGEQTAPITEYIFSINSTAHKNLMDISASEIKTGNELLIRKLETQSSISDVDYSVHLNSPLRPENKLSIKIIATFLRHFEPQPKSIKINEDAFYRCLPSSRILSYSKSPSPVSADDNTLTFGPYSRIDQLDTAPISVHFFMEETPSIITDFARSISISHFSGSISLDDYTELLNDGPKLIDYNRVDYYKATIQRSLKNTMNGFNVHVPLDARNIYYTDIIGNVSTSHVSRSEVSDSLLLQLKPRFPVMSGWKFSFNVGYTSSLSNYLKYNPSTKKYSFKAYPYSDPIEMGIKNYKLQITLPEGAYDIEYNPSFGADSVEITTEKGYLGFFGSKKIVFSKKNTSPSEIGPVYVMYKYSNLQLLLKPIIVSMFLFGIYLAFSMLGSYIALVDSVKTTKDVSKSKK
ncbi:hypothetical protein BB560_003712 [Smittium megazygosporum]|uniref:Dolichyl-diphosphooligosaccharide--protein glycosyltransferase subunit 1 n=1 Tax=Smittium megazygosporum TaxID=133381 RepID=A0A2T9ZB82_9FUNG|nr:hypothetical protein BB560_003712 [Smittium megazygosporum]